MKCPKCGYTSFPYLESCRTCGQGLMEQRAAMGIYGLPPNPPDLLLAYQTDSMDVMWATLPSSPSASHVDLGRLEGIELEIAEAELTGSGTPEVGEQAGGAATLVPTFDLEPSAVEEEVQSVDLLGAEPLGSHDTVVPTTVDLHDLGDMTLELDNETDPRDQPPETVQPSSPPAEVQQVYDLDMNEDLEGLTLGLAADESAVGGDAEEITEYTLEIEEDIEIEVDELELGPNDEVEEGDDDDR